MANNSTPGLSLSVKLLISFLVAALVPLNVLLFFNIRATRTSQETIGYNTLSASASHTSLRLNGFIQDNLNVIRAEAQLPVFSDFLTISASRANIEEEKNQVTDILSSLKRKNHVFLASYALLDHTGRNVADTEPENVGKNLSGRSYFLKTLENGFPYVSDVEFDESDNRAYLYFSSTVQDSNGRFIGVLRSKFSATVLQQLIVQDTGLVGPKSFAMLINQDHLILAYGIFSHGAAEKTVFNPVTAISTQDAETLTRKRRLPLNRKAHPPFDLQALKNGLDKVDSPRPFFVSRLPFTEDVRFAGAVTRIPNMPWMVAFFQPLDVFHTPADAQVLLAVIITASVAVLISLAALFWSRYLSRPMLQLARVAKKISEGDLSAEYRIKSRDEIGILSETLNLMTRRLRRRLKLESFISSISKKFINIKLNDIRTVIDHTLKDIGRFTGADRVILFQPSGRDLKVLVCTSEWVKPGITQPHEISRTLSVNEYPQFFESLSGEGLISFTTINETDLHLAAPYWLSRNTASAICVTIPRPGDSIGFIGIESIEEIGRFRSDTLYLLNMSAEIIGSALERRQIEVEKESAYSQIHNLQNYLSNVINSMPSVLIGVDQQIRVTQWNMMAEDKIGITAENARGVFLPDLIPWMLPELEKISNSIVNRQIVLVQKRPRSAADRTCYEDMTIYPLVTDGKSGGAVIRIDDVTEKVEMEEIMVQSERMLSVGGLAAGMAHEINNPLAGMLQSANVMKSRLQRLDMKANIRAADEIGISMRHIREFMEKRGIFSMINDINESGSRVVEIIDNMLGFARKTDTVTSSHYPDRLLNQTLELAASDYDLKKQYDFKTIKIVRAYEENLPMLPCEGSKIQQVFLNILRNGSQAMHTHGTCDGLPPTFILRVAVESLPPMVRIEIQDNGPGMNEHTRKKIFEPFFTTKPVGEGTGLGLSVSYFIIVENHGGTLDVVSAPGKGTNFILRLPLERDG